MATYDLTSKSTAFVNADSIASAASEWHEGRVKVQRAYLDIAELIKNGYTMAAGDVFQLLEIKANSYVLMAGAEVVVAFDGTTPTVDIDFAGGDDIVDGGDVTSTGRLASGTNGQADTIQVTGSSTFGALITTTDTIDVTLAAGASDVTTGVLRVDAVVIDLSDRRLQRANEVTRDQLA